MTRKFELSIDVNYVKSWGIKEAVREYFQNSYDEEQQNPENKSFFEYNENDHCLRIGNKLSVLKSETLLLGCTSKESDENTIGQFGEGYKIATVVALRTGHNVTIYNYGAREIWTTKLVKSRKYNGRLVPTFYISTEFNWSSLFRSKNEEKNLIIEITNVTSEEYKAIFESNLNLRLKSYNFIETSFGDILIDKEHKGNVYVSGLYVYTNDQMDYGYNIKSKYLQLDRDRMAVNSFDLQWVTSKMWVESVINNKSSVDNFMEMLENNETDIYYVGSIFDTISTSNSRERIVNEIYHKFIEKYGKAIPVDSEELRRKLKLSDNEVAFTSSRMMSFLNLYSGSDTVVPKKETYYQRYKKLLNDLRKFMTDEQAEEADYLLDHTKYALGGDE